jgi:predicted DNA-binding transcriptional regulator AlpA
VRITGLSKGTIKRRMNDHDGAFPNPIKLSPRRIVGLLLR